MDIHELAEMTTTLIVYHIKGVISIDNVYSVIKNKLYPDIAVEAFNELAKFPDDPNIRSEFRSVLEKQLSSDERFANWLNEKVGSVRSGLRQNVILDGYEVVHRESAGEVSASANRFMLTLDQPETTGRRTLRDWWFEIQRRFQGYSCYGIFLVLPSDKEIIRYLSDFGIELDIISRNNCLMIYLSDGNFRRPNFKTDDWKYTIERHVSGGGSAQIARLFGIEYDKLPCLLLFQDVYKKPYNFLLIFPHNLAFFKRTDENHYLADGKIHNPG